MISEPENLPNMESCLDLRNNAAVKPDAPVCMLGELLETSGRDVVGCIAQMNLEHHSSRVLVRERDVDPLLKPERRGERKVMVVMVVRGRGNKGDWMHQGRGRRRREIITCDTKFEERLIRRLSLLHTVDA